MLRACCVRDAWWILQLGEVRNVVNAVSSDAITVVELEGVEEGEEGEGLEIGVVELPALREDEGGECRRARYKCPVFNIRYLFISSVLFLLFSF